MPACPAGHESSASDFCDICGMRIEGAAPSSTSSASGGYPAGSAPAASPAPGAGPGRAVPGATAAAAAPPAEPCPQCGTARSGQFCEVCGFDFSSGTPARTAAPSPAAEATAPNAATAAPAGPAAEAAAAWTAVVAADREYFDRVIVAGGPVAQTIEFPAYCPERRFELTGKEMRVGRRSASRGLEPEIDLTGPPADPGISHLHAVLIAQPDGTWSVLDPGSSNGTQVNGAGIATGVAVPLKDGDRVCIGAWTVLTLHG